MRANAPRAYTWYFGYGSNMDPRTFLGRRRMSPLETAAARLDGWGLRFDLPIGKGERAVANVRRQADEYVWGVAYQISLRDAAHLDRTEGVPRAYRRVEVDLMLAEGSVRRGYTLASERGLPGRKPSRRYMGLLLAGARHHGLPEAYVRFLRGFELAIDERERQQELFSR
ncbi:MAG: gamma-glutamylcyclotransferase [Miltoncostaeaceae bacterium]